MSLYQFFAESLSTHSLLSSEEIDWLSQILDKIPGTETQKVLAGLMMNKKTFTGVYAKMYNLTIDNIASERLDNPKRAEERLKKLMGMNFNSLYPELNDNTLLTPGQQALAKKVMDGEYQATLMVVKGMKHERGNLMPYKEERLPAALVRTNTISYNSHYELICIKAETYLNNIVSGNLITLDPNTGKKYCFDKNTLLARFAVGIYNNPTTNEMLPKDVIDFVERQFEIELKLLRRPVYTKKGDIPIISNEGTNYKLSATPAYINISSPKAAGTPLPTMINGVIPSIKTMPKVTKIPEVSSNPKSTDVGSSRSVNSIPFPSSPKPVNPSPGSKLPSPSSKSVNPSPTTPIPGSKLPSPSSKSVNPISAPLSSSPSSKSDNPSPNLVIPGLESIPVIPPAIINPSPITSLSKINSPMASSMASSPAIFTMGSPLPNKSSPSPVSIPTIPPIRSPKTVKPPPTDNVFGDEEDMDGFAPPLG